MRYFALLILFLLTSVNVSFAQDDYFARVDSDFTEGDNSMLFSFVWHHPRGLSYDFQSLRVNGVSLVSLSGDVPYSAIGSLYGGRRWTSLGFDSEDWMSSIGANSSFDTGAMERNYLTFAASSRSYSYRLGGGVSFSENGWSGVLDVNWRGGRSMSVEGVWADRYNIVLSGSKEIGHGKLQITALINPNERAMSRATTHEAYCLAENNLYNPAWGIQNGKERSADVRKTFEPIIIVNHEVALTDKLNLLSGAALRFGRSSRSALNWQSAPNPLPDYYAYMPSFQTSQSAKDEIIESWQDDVNSRQLDFANFYEINSNSAEAHYILENRISQPLYLTAQSRLATDNFSFGISASYEVVKYYKELSSLFGGGYWLDVDKFVEQDDDNKDVTQNNLLSPNRQVVEGERFGYDYELRNFQFLADGAWSYSFDDFEFLATSQLALTTAQREGFYEKENFGAGGSLGNSLGVMGVDFGGRVGLKWRPLTNFNVDGYIGYNTISPRNSQIFVAPLYNNMVRENLSNSQVLSAELGLNYACDVFKISGALYYYGQSGDSYTLSLYDDILKSYVYYPISDISTSRAGVELAAKLNIYDKLWAEGTLALSRNIYTNNPVATAYSDSDGDKLIDSETIYYEGKHIGGAPENTASLSLSYEPYGWNVSVTALYYSGGYESLSPVRYTHRASIKFEDAEQRKLSSGFSLDFFGGYTFKFQNDNALRLYLSVGNILNNKSMEFGAYQSNRLFRDGMDYTPQPSRSRYALGVNFLMGAIFYF